MKSVPNKCSNCTWSARCKINQKLDRLFSGGNYASRSCRSWTKETFAKVNGGREGLVAIAGCSSVLFSNVYFQIQTLSSKLLFFWKIVSMFKGEKNRLGFWLNESLISQICYREFIRGVICKISIKYPFSTENFLSKGAKIRQKFKKNKWNHFFSSNFCCCAEEVQLQTCLAVLCGDGKSKRFRLTPRPA